MRNESLTPEVHPAPHWETLEQFVRLKIQDCIPALLHDEVTEWLGRNTSARMAAVTTDGHDDGQPAPTPGVGRAV